MTMAPGPYLVTCTILTPSLPLVQIRDSQLTQL
jgi:hypothetical protein